MPTPTIPAGNLFMNATLYTGTGATRNVENGVAGQAFQPDFVWVKTRSISNASQLTDSVRGVNLALASNLTIAEYTGEINAFNSNGFQVTGNAGATNGTGTTYVAWQWKAGGTAVTNTAGSITSSVSANTTSGFSVVTYTGNGTGGATVGHGLGVAPNFVIIKCRSNATNWFVGGSNVASAGNGTWSSVMEGLNTTAAVNTGATAVFNSTAPTSSVITLGTETNANGSGRTFVIYAWNAVAGYSAFGSYTGNGSADGPFVYTGFRPRFLLTKRSDAIESWRIGDSSRSPYNGVVLELFANLANAEENNSNPIDYLSNGFKIRTSSSSHNASGGTYIYMAFAENPFKYANAR